MAARVEAASHIGSGEVELDDYLCALSSFDTVQDPSQGAVPATMDLSSCFD